jgi:RNA polymerase sigma-70 factor (ECF subfamily)
METRLLHSDLESIYRLHRAGLFAVALAITRSSSDAEDAVHDAFARLCGRADMNGTDPVAYAYIAVRNAAIDRLRRRRGNEPLSISIQAALERSAHGVTDNERDRAIAAAIDELEPEHRAPLLLRIFCGLTFRQISQIENAPLPTIASRYNAALERLRPKLKEWL